MPLKACELYESWGKAGIAAERERGGLLLPVLFLLAAVRLLAKGSLGHGSSSFMRDSPPLSLPSPLSLKVGAVLNFCQKLDLLQKQQLPRGRRQTE